MTERRYVVTAFGGVNASGERREAWHEYQGAAENDIRERLGVEKLHVKARSSGYVSDDGKEMMRHPDGSQWRRYAYYDFYRVPASHPDHDRSGGFKISFMERVGPD